MKKLGIGVLVTVLAPTAVCFVGLKGTHAQIRSMYPLLGDNARAFRADVGPEIRELILQHLCDLGQFREQLNLSEYQRGQLADIVRAYAESIRPAVETVIEHKRTLGEAVISEQASEKAIRDAAAQSADAIGDVAVILAAMVDEARAVLTPEQREVIAQFHETRDSRREERRGIVLDWLKERFPAGSPTI